MKSIVEYVALVKLAGEDQVEEAVIETDFATAMSFKGDFVGLLLYLGIDNHIDIIMKLNNVNSSAMFDGKITKIKTPDESLLG